LHIEGDIFLAAVSAAYPRKDRTIQDLDGLDEDGLGEEFRKEEPLPESTRLEIRHEDHGTVNITMGKETKKTAPKGKKTSKKNTKIAELTDQKIPTEITFSLERAAGVLGAADPLLEQAIRASHPDEVLRAEGIKLASERILADGERLCNHALSLLESKDPEVQKALVGAGLSRGWLALTVDALLRLKGHASQGKQQRHASAQHKAATTASLEATVAEGRKRRRLALERLELVVKGRPDLETALQQNRQSPTNFEELAGQLDGLATLIEGTLQHTDPLIRTLAQARRLSQEEASALRTGAQLIRESLDTKGPAGTARQKEHQAILDVLDGLCLLLLGEVFRALRTVAELTPKARRPTLYTLRSYYIRAGVSGAEEEAPPAS
jgi:hypothetical protein